VDRRTGLFTILVRFINTAVLLEDLQDKLAQWRFRLREHPEQARRGLKQLIVSSRVSGLSYPRAAGFHP
jgi:hypothetical protein